MSRKALVIGNGAYTGGHDLKNATNDAKAIANAFRKNGFEVDELIDINAHSMDEAVRSLHKRLTRDGAGVFYFAGHGVQIDATNYLLAIDADATTESSARYHSLKLDYLISLMNEAGSETNIVILDACRDNPWGARWTRSVGLGGLAPVIAPRGTLIAFSTSPGQKSFDGTGSHGRYTEALLQHIDAVCPVETMFKRVRRTLAATTAGKQIPWEHTSLVAEFFFNQSRNVPVTVYSDQAIQDGTFLADPANPAHLILKELRAHDWYRQNPAVDSLRKANVNAFSENDCFMIGRALYAAADGSSRAAIFFIKFFAQASDGVDPTRRKALLDGILFEIFFGSDGRLRSTPKLGLFDKVFELAKIEELRPSFEFLADALIDTGKRFHAFPDLDNDVAVDVMTRTDEGKSAPAVTAVMIAGRNVLHPDEPTYVADESSYYAALSEEEFSERLSAEGAIPRSRLVITYPDLGERPGELRFPLGYTVQWAV